MSKSAILAFAVATIGLAATPALCAPVDLSAAAATQPAITAQGGPNVAPLIDNAQQLSNIGLAAEGATDQVFGGATALDTGSLKGSQGGTNIANTFTGAVTSQDLSASSTGNMISAGQIVNGAITVAPNAFSGFNGVGNVLMNTGNQNNIQGSLSLTVVITPPAAGL